MLDYRIYTFLQLCDTMNYHKTEEILHMTQPAVTQHIHFLEKEYGCKFFIYNGKILEKTKESYKLEAYARSAQYNEDILKKDLISKPIVELRIGATKTIGEYVINKQINNLFCNDNYKLYKKESFLGICSKTHPFAEKNISFEKLFKETLIIREKGSGTREIFERIQMLKNIFHPLKEN